MADMTKVKLPDNTTLNVKDPVALASIYNESGYPYLRTTNRAGNVASEALKAHIEKVFITKEQEKIVNNKTYFICSQEVAVDDSGTVVSAKILPSSKRYFISAAYGNVNLDGTGTTAFAMSAGANIATKLAVLNGSYKSEFVMTSTGKLCKVTLNGNSALIQALYGTLAYTDFDTAGTFIVEVLNNKDAFTSSLNTFNGGWYTSYPEGKRNLIVTDFDYSAGGTLKRVFLTSAYSVDQAVEVSAVSMQYLNTSGSWVNATGTFTRQEVGSQGGSITTGSRYGYVYTPAGTISNTPTIVKVTMTFTDTAPATQEYYTIVNNI